MVILLNKNLKNIITSSISNSINTNSKGAGKGRGNGQGKGSGRGSGRDKGENFSNVKSQPENSKLQKLSDEYNNAYSNAKKANQTLLETRTISSILVKEVSNYLNNIKNLPEEFSQKLNGIEIKRKKYRYITDIGEKKEILSKSNSNIKNKSNFNPNSLFEKSTKGKKLSKGINTIGKSAGKAAAVGKGMGMVGKGVGKAAVTTGATSALSSLAGPIGIGIAGISYLASNSKKRNSEDMQKIRNIENETILLKNFKIKTIKFNNITKKNTEILENIYLKNKEINCSDYTAYSKDEKIQINNLILNMENLASLLNKAIKIK